MATQEELLRELTISSVINLFTRGAPLGWSTGSDIPFVAATPFLIATNRSGCLQSISIVILTGAGGTIGFDTSNAVNAASGMIIVHGVANGTSVVQRPGDSLYGRATATGTMSVFVTPITLGMLGQFYKERRNSQ